MGPSRIKVLLIYLILINIPPISFSISHREFETNLDNIIKSESESSLSQSPDSWWNMSYSYRTRITIQNKHSEALPANLPISLKIDTLSLVNARKLQADGQDLRVAWYNEGSGKWAEIDRLNKSTFNTPETEILFKTKKSIPPNKNDSNYFLYYCCSTAGAPPTNEREIYTFYDDFTQKDGDAQGWQVIQGNDWSVVNNEYRESELASNRLTIVPTCAITDAVIEVRVKSDGIDFGLGILWRFKNKSQFYAAVLGLKGWEMVVGKMQSSTITLIENSGNPESILIPNKWYDLKIHAVGSRIMLYLNDILQINVTDNDILSEGQIGLITWNENNASYFDDFKVREAIETPPQTILDQEELRPPNGNGDDELFNPVFLILIILALVGSALAAFTINSRRRRPLHPKKAISHPKLQFHKTNEIPEPVPDERLDELILQHHIDEIHKLGDELFSDGAYLDVINHFNQTSITLLKYGLIDEAFTFSQRATKLKALVDEREKKLQLLEREKQRNDLMEVLLLYNDIIELSRKLNDLQAVDYYQYELHQVRSGGPMTPKQQASLATPLAVRPVTAAPPVSAQVKEVKLKKIITSFHSEIQNFAAKDLERKRDTFEKRAKYLEDQKLFKAAVFFYDKCEEISNQLAQIGKTDEEFNAQKYNEKKVACSQKQHYEEKKAEFSQR
ncbi:MAG: hypothetical protein HWN65_17110 [Candidatus Helarchaeota archaeon]|nr:hypothetical protein [Candidatus Helarchaeota archaeon]